MTLDLQIAQDDWLDRHSMYSVCCMPFLTTKTLAKESISHISKNVWEEDIFYIKFKFLANSEMLK